MAFVEQVTLLGDSAILLPLSLGYGLWLHRRQSPDVAAHWLRAICLCAAIVATLKVAGFTANQLLNAPRFGSPSGHTALAGTFYVCAALAWSRSPWRHLATALALAAMVAVGLSRIAMGAHDALEVGVGGAVGLAVAARFLLWRQRPGARLSLWWAGAGSLIIGRVALFAQGVTPEQAAKLVGSAFATMLGSAA